MTDIRYATPCGPGPDDKYCPAYWQLSAENQRMRGLLDEALHLAVNGERAPGGDETWPAWSAKAERYLREVT